MVLTDKTWSRKNYYRYIFCACQCRHHPKQRNGHSWAEVWSQQSSKTRRHGRLKIQKLQETQMKYHSQWFLPYLALFARLDSFQQVPKLLRAIAPADVSI